MKARGERWLRALSVALTVGVLLGAVAISAGAMAAESDGPKVDINKATEQELTTIRGIGETLAKRIVAFREEHGPFRRPEDLMKVRGIGEKSFEKIRPFITVGKTS